MPMKQLQEKSDDQVPGTTLQGPFLGSVTPSSRSNQRNREWVSKNAATLLGELHNSRGGQEHLMFAKSTQ